MSSPLLLLHGAIGAADQLQVFNTLSRTSVAFDFPGHGGKAFPEEFSIRAFAESVLRRMDEQQFSAVDIFGYSMGGYVALYMARHYPERVGKIFTLATKFGWDEATAAKEVKMLNPEKIAEKVPKFAAALEKRHAPLDWKEVLKRTADLMLALGKNPELTKDDFAAITHPVLLSVGDRDMMVSIEETMQVYRSLPNAQFMVFPNTVHPIEQVNLQQLLPAIELFLA